jgi:hypothetical protein
MIDHNVVSTERTINEEIEAAEHACYIAAIAHGLTQEQADECDDGDKGCPLCPWRKA